MNPAIVRSVLLVLLLLFGGLLVMLGYFSGQRSAAAKFNLAQVNETSLALSRFYTDQERFPTEEEFLEPSVFGQYLSKFPLALKEVSKCEHGPEYKASVLSRYELEFCLPANAGSFVAGWWKTTDTGSVELIKAF